MRIPKQLKNCKFCKIKKGEKAPFEMNWQNRDYSYDLISQYFPQMNYGVLTGINELGVLDDDSEDKVLIKLFEEHFKETFRVRNHYYVKLLNWNGKKIIFYDENKKHLGELQGKGQQVVGAGSLHPSGEYYEQKNNLQIKEIEYSDFKKAFGKYLKKEETIKEINKNSIWKGEDMNRIPISNIIYPNNAKSKGSSIQGSHPIHGSNTGSNFAINTSDNTWYCFRCGTGGGVWTAIAMTEGITDCSSCSKNHTFSDLEKKEIVKIAHEKYGLKFPEKEIKIDYANNIKNSLESHEEFTCPQCKGDLISDGKIVQCSSCSYFNSLRKYLLYKK